MDRIADHGVKNRIRTSQNIRNNLTTFEANKLNCGISCQCVSIEAKVFDFISIKGEARSCAFRCEGVEITQL